MPKGLQSRFPPEASFKLGEWLVETDLHTISRGSATIHLEAKIMKLLVFLARRGSRLVTRREIIDGVWGTEYICDNTLTHAISEVRTALGDNARNPGYIQTIHRRGYRMLAPVTSLEGRELMDPGRPSRYWIVTGSRVVRLRRGINLIGRAPEATVHVDSVWVSREHARVIVHGGGTAIIEDLDSRNGTFVNGRRVARATPLADGDTIYLGKLTDVLRFASGGPKVSTEACEEETPIPPLLKA
jgi:DNA-binding winged helix-turn-helix (wHTH) protein